jgi:hypothetical protein
LNGDNDGGPAFPVSSYVNNDGDTHDSFLKGMSLRDYFAGQAMTTLCRRQDFSILEIAEQAYLFADAMLKERMVQP